MISESYAKMKITPKDKRRFQDDGWVSKYMDHARSVDPEMTDRASELINMIYDIAREDDPNIGEDRLKACFILADVSARMRFSTTVDTEDAHRAAMIVFPE